MQETRSDEAIVESVQQGNGEAFGLLIARYEQKLLRYATKFLSHTEDIQDVIQDIFIKTYTNIQSFNTSRRFSPWLYRIAHNELVNVMKKKGKEKMAFFDFDTFFPHPMAPDTADSEAHRKELRTMLEVCLDGLSVNYREVLILYFFEEMSYSEIASVLHIPIATVGIRLQRAKQQLKTMYEQRIAKD